MRGIKDALAKFFEKLKRKGGETEEDEFKVATPEEARKKLKIYAIVALVVLFVVILLLSSRGEKKKSDVGESPPDSSLMTSEDSISITPPVSDIEILRQQWMETTGKEVDSLKAQVQRLQDVVTQLTEQLKTQNELIRQLQQRPSQAPPQIPSSSAVSDSFSYRSGVMMDTTAIKPPSKIKAIVPFDTTAFITPESTQAQPEVPPPPKESTEEGIVEVDTGYIYLPTGSYVRVKFLTAIDAPCGKDVPPYPVLMRIEDKFQMPNSVSSGSAIECFVLGEAKGELSTGRALIRTQKISCITSRTARSAIDAPIQGWIISAVDGRLGLPGEVESRQGSKIALSMLANALKAMGEIGTQTQFTTVVNPGTGSVQQVFTGDVAKAAGYKALGETGQQMAEWFMERAKEIYPVISVPAGGEGILFLKDGLKIKLGGLRDVQEYSVSAELDAPK